MRLPSRPMLVLAGATLATLAVAGGVLVTVLDRGDQPGRDSAQDTSMTSQAQSVMPFDLDKTTHTFAKTSTGGVETVVANDAADSRNIGLIRSHLQREAREFTRGNYSDPAAIHGMDMPGLRELKAGASRVDVTYQPYPDGARIVYASAEPALVSALHSWFDRQNSDHAMPGMGG